MDKILIVDDDEMMRDTVVSYLSNDGCSLIVAPNGKKGVELFRKEKPDLVISDIRMPEMNGLELLSAVRNLNCHIPVLLMTAYDDMDITIKAMQLGAYDYIEKPFNKEKLSFLVKRALERKKLNERLEVIDAESFNSKKYYSRLVGKSEAMLEIIKKIGRVSANRMTVLIEGESGTGKEVISKIIHYAGITKNEPLIAVNCTALSDTLLESELFGHVKGSFTGAIRDKKGKFELAGSGTIFLDEISEISNEIQVKLLRVLQEKEFERVGDETTIKINARIIAATNKNLIKLVEEGKFREDLYYRLNVCNIKIPPLRERKEDIPDLVISLLKKINSELHKNIYKVPYEVMEMLQNHNWAGNIRELENTLQEAVVFAQDDVLEKENIFLRDSKLNGRQKEKEKMSLDEAEEEHLVLILNSVNWNKKEACKILKTTRPTLDKKIKMHNIERSSV